MKPIALLLLLAVTTSGATITVDPSTSFQTMTGWEAASQAGQIDFPSNYAVYGSTLLDQVVEMGLNRCRLEIQGDIENSTPRPTHIAINDNADPNSYNASGFNWTEFDTNVTGVVIPWRNRLIAQGETLYLNLCYVDFLNNGQAFYHCNDAAEYAELILAGFDRMSSTWGFVPDAVEVILEPEAGNNTTRWTATKVANCLISAQSRLATAGYHPTFILPSTTDCREADTWYNDVKAANSNVTQYISELSYHRYAACNQAQLQENRDAAQADGKRISMLEYWNSPNDYTILHADIGADGNAVSWQAAVLTYPNVADNAPIAGVYFLTLTADNSVAIASRTKFYRQYFKWIRRDAVRKGTSTSDANFDGLAFRNTRGNYTVVVKALTSGSPTIGGLPAATYHITYTTAGSYNQTQSDQVITAGQNITLTVTGAGVWTVHADAPTSSSFTMGKAALGGKATIR